MRGICLGYAAVTFLLTCLLFNRPSQITDAAGTRIPQYSEAGQFEGETITGGVLNGFSVATGYDSLLRKNAFSVSRGNTVLAENGWGYDALSRMETVTQGNDTGSYTYHANSSLPATLTHKRGAATVLTTSKTFDALGRLEVLIHTPAIGQPVVFDYAYNATGLRETITSADNAFWTMSYNDRAELTSGVRKAADQTPFPGQDFGYQFDDIGNRLTATVNGRVSTYTPNAVNAYESRTVPGYVNILGEAASDADVTVNSTSAERLGNYFYAELAVNNTAAPVQAAVTTVATRGQETATVTSQRFVPKTPEIFTYDDDGNLISDGRWINVWDAENRLIQQTATASAVAAGAKNLRLTFAYDHAGRRIKKTVSAWDGLAWVFQYSLNYLYDGWNLAAEVAANGGPTLRSYAWGADLSAGEAAGGIGGLTFIRFHLENKTLAVAADAQGNTSALYDMEDAALQGTYEYGPFGEPLRASGPFAAVNPFRFSTQYETPETGWLGYTHRDYIPALGRWASQDPIGEAGGINLRAFVGNNPVNFVDPFGLSTVRIHTDGGVVTLVDPSISEFRSTISAQPAGSINRLDILGHGNRNQIIIEPGLSGHGLIWVPGVADQIMFTDNSESFSDLLRDRLSPGATVDLKGYNTAREGPLFDNQHITRQVSIELPGVTAVGSRGFAFGNELSNPFNRDQYIRFGTENHVFRIPLFYQNGVQK